MRKSLFAAMVVMSMNLSGCFYAAVTATKMVEDAVETPAEARKPLDRFSTKYQASADNTAVLKAAAVAGSVSVGQFDSFEPGLNKLMCRLDGYVRPPRGLSYAEYVRSGLVAELEAAGVYKEKSSVVLTGKLDDVSFSSMSGNWSFSLTISSSNGRSITVSDKYGYSSGFGGNAACDATRDAFIPAVYSLVAKIIRDPGFPALLVDGERRSELTR